MKPPGVKIEKIDKRYKKFRKQRKKRGWDDTETWNLDHSIAEFLVPRLKRFKKLNNGFPCGLTPEGWDEILDQMIEGFQAKIDSDGVFGDEYTGLHEKIERALELFKEHFHSLWW